MKNILIAILTSIIITFACLWLAINLTWQSFGMETELFGSTLTTINATDKISTLPTNLNTNFTALNTDKLERTDFFATTTLPSITTLSGLTSATSLESVGTITTGNWNASVLTVTYGGTGSSTLEQYAVLLGNGTGSINAVQGLGTTGQVLKSNGATSSPSWDSVTTNETLDYDWTGSHSFATTTSFATSTHTTLVVDGVTIDELKDGGNTALHTHKSSNGSFTATTTGNLNVAHGLGHTPQTVQVNARIHCNPANAAHNLSVGSYSSNGANVSYYINGGTSVTTQAPGAYAWAGADNGGTTICCRGTVSSVNSTNIVFNVDTYTNIGSCQVSWSAF